MNYFNQYYFSEIDQKQARNVPISINTIRPAVTAIDESFRRSIGSILDKNKDDKKIGLLLSGGVDSSLLLGMLKNLTDKEIVCFTAMTDASDPDVFPSKEVARAFNSRWVKCRLVKADLPSKLATLLPAAKGGLYATAHDVAMDICLDHCKQEGINNLWMGSGLDMFFGGGVDPGLFKADTEHKFHNLFWRHSFNLLVNRFYNQDGTHLNSLAQKTRYKGYHAVRELGFHFVCPCSTCQLIF